MEVIVFFDYVEECCGRLGRPGGAAGGQGAVAQPHPGGRSEPARRVALLQTGLEHQEEHGVRAQVEELHRSAEGVDPQGPQHAESDQVRQRSGQRHRRGQAQDDGHPQHRPGLRRPAREIRRIRAAAPRGLAEGHDAEKRRKGIPISFPHVSLAQIWLI